MAAKGRCVVKLSLGMLVLSGCTVLDGSGVPAEETRDVAGFSAVANETQVAVSVVPGDQDAVVVYCDDNIVDSIRTQIHGNWLEVSTPNNTQIHPNVDCGVDVTASNLHAVDASGSADLVAEGEWPDLEDVSSSGSGDVRVTGRLPALASIDSSGSGHITVDGIESADVHIDTSGSGGIDALGTTESFSYDTSGSGDIDAMDLHAVDGDVDSSGSGGVKLYATGHVTIDISGSGDVVVAGGASTDVDRSGSGDVIER
jgi:hypothetical protein